MAAAAYSALLSASSMGIFLDAAEIEDRHDGVAEEHEHEHLDISGRLHVEGEPAAVGEHDLPPGQLHGRRRRARR